MFENIVENLSNIFKSNETKEFAQNSAENIAKICLTGDPESGMREAYETIKYVGSIKDILFWSKVKKWLQKTYEEPEMEAKISSKFTEDNEKYKEYTKRQLQYIAQVDEEEKIEYYANLTRAWLMGYIQTSLYFKMAYLLNVFTLEEIEYLKKNYTEKEFEGVNFYIREFSLYGLIDIVQETDHGNSLYKYSELANIFLRVGIAYGEHEIDFCNLGLLDLRVENTKTSVEWGGINIC